MPPESVDANVSLNDIPEIKTVPVPEEEEILNSPVEQDEEPIEIQIQNQTSSNPEEQPMNNVNSESNNCD